ncbi:hypothetical protein QQF64_036013, partial [Cirrhinus molitorella]
FDGCGLDETCCKTVSSVLQSNSHLIELDLSNNHLQDSGVTLIYDGLKNSHCQLKILRLYGCHLTAQSCESLSSALQSSNTVLRELDLSNNDLQDSGVKLLSEGLKSPNSQMEILRLSGCMVTEKGCHHVSSALTSNPSHLKELDLSYNHPGDSGVKLLSEKLSDPKCSLNKLNVDHGGESRITAGLKKYACFLTLDPNTANTKLSLSEENRKGHHTADRKTKTSPWDTGHRHLIWLSLNQKRQNPDADVIQFWNENSKSFPSLAKVARSIFSVLSGSASAERVFSAASLVSRNHRTSLKPQTLSKLVFLKVNSKEL